MSQLPNMGRMATAPQKVLFIHQNFPGQFASLALDLMRDPACQVLAIGKQGCPGLHGVRTLTYALHRASAKATHHYARSYEAGILHGQAVLRMLLSLKTQGFAPDVIVAHPGWGETLFVKQAFPAVRLIHFCEFYYHGAGADTGFDPEFPASLDDVARTVSKNALMLINLENCDVAVSPTSWQKSLHPLAYQGKIRCIHEGVDTHYMRADPTAVFTLRNGKVLRPGDPVLTYVARNLEPYRGFHSFMRTLPAILERHATCDIVIVGGDGVSYGAKPKDALHCREKMLRETGIASERVHFLGKISYPAYRSLLQGSAAHVYLTYPFVLSWSMLEAMACGCLLIASDTAPVREVIQHGDNGMLIDFFDVDALSATVLAALDAPEAGLSMRLRAVQTVRNNYSLQKGNSDYRALMGLITMASAVATSIS